MNRADCRLSPFDENASDDQEQALLEVFTGKAGGPVAEFAELIGEVVAVERAPIVFATSAGEGRLTVGDTVAAEIEALLGATGRRTVLAETAFSTVPGSPAYCAESKSDRLNAPARVQPRHLRTKRHPGRVRLRRGLTVR